jgi:predicted DNA-binding transcriptional regulator AlpA
MLSPQKASEIAGVSRKTIMNHIKDMTLPAKRNNKSQWIIAPEDLEQWMANRRESASQWNSTVSSQQNTTSSHSIVSPHSEIAYAAAYEVKKTEVEILRNRVSQLEQEVSEARQDARDARQSFNDLSSKLVDMITAQPLLLSQNYRIK